MNSLRPVNEQKTLILRENNVSNASEAALRTQAPSKTSPKVTRKTRSKISNSRTTLKNRTNYAQRRLLYANYMKMTSAGCPTA